MPIPIPFDPEGEGYDEETARELIEMYPLTLPKPKKFQGEYVTQPNAFQSWVWHPDKKDYFIHGGSRDPRTGLILKGRKYPTYWKTEESEKAGGYEIFFKDGRYYSKKPEEMTTEEYRLWREQQKARVNNLGR